MGKTATYIILKGKLKNLITRLFGNKKYQKLVILGRQRTGSSLLMMILHSHPKIDMESEVFRLLKGKSCRTVWKETFSKKLPWIKYAGFKLFYNHPDDSEDREVWDILKTDTNTKIIHIKRENILRTYISKLIALKTGAWDSRQEKVSTDALDKRVNVDIEHCLSELKKIKNLETEFGKSRFPNHPYIELSFESLIEDKDSQMQRIFSFLKLEHKKMDNIKGNLKRQNPEKVENLVVNYKELKMALLNTEFATLIE